MTLGVWQCPDIPNIPYIPDIPLFLPLRTFPTVSNIPIIQISSSLWFQKCMTLGVWQCPDIPNIHYIPDIPLFLPFLPLGTFQIYYQAKSEGHSSKIGWAIAIWIKCANFPRSRRWRRRRTNLSTILLDLMTIYSWERGTINWSCKKFYLVYYCWRGYKV